MNKKVKLELNLTKKQANDLFKMLMRGSDNYTQAQYDLFSEVKTQLANAGVNTDF